MSILIVRRGIQGPRGLSGLAARESLIIAANIDAIVTVADNVEAIIAADFSAENITYDNNTSGLTAIEAQSAIDELAASTSDSSDAIAIIQAVLAVMLPIGSIVPFAGAGAPNGYLQCYGQAVSRTTYAALFTAIGVAHGAGDGTTTFNVPDLRGRCVVGQDNMGGTSANRLTGLTGGINGDVLGGIGGAETHTLTIAQMPAHHHATKENVVSHASTGRVMVPNDAAGTASPTPMTDVGGGLAHNNVQPSIVLNYLIKHS